MSITSEVETITPETAAQWLSTSKLNRRIYNQVVDRYVRAIQNGDWMINGEAIVFDNTKTLVNGHHRLTACIKAGKSFQSLIVRGVETKAFDTFDSGRARSAGDVFGLQGYDHAKWLGATLQLVWRHEIKGTVSSTNSSASVQELEEILREHPGVISSVDYCVKLQGIAPVSCAAFMHYYGARRNPDTADLFVDSLYDGANLSVDSPIKQLRDRFLQNRGRRGSLPRITQLALIIKCYSYFAAELPLRHLFWSSGEAFPALFTIDKDTVRNKVQQMKRAKEGVLDGPTD